MKKYIPILVIILSLGFQTIQAQTIYGAVSELPGGVFKEMSGTPGDNLIGTAAGKDFTFSSIDLLNQTDVYFGTILDSVKLSLDGGEFDNDGTTMQEVLQFSPEMSNLDSGLLAWTGITRIPEQPNTPVFTKFYMRFTTVDGKLPLVDAASVGLDPYVGGVPILTPGISFSVNFQFLASYSLDSASYQPHIPFYDVNSLTDGLAFSSVGYGWYWENSPPQLDLNNAISVNENDTVTVTEQFLLASDVESDSSMITLELVETPEALPVNGGLYKNNVKLNFGDTFTKEDVMEGNITYVHDGTETLHDSAALRLSDSDMAYYHMDGDSTFYLVFNITPVDDLPIVEVNESFDIMEEEEKALSAAYILTTDSESNSPDITYTIDPEGKNDWPKNGLLKKNSVPMSSGDTFTQEDVENGMITYKHDGTESVTDGFLFSVVDEFGHPAEMEDGTTVYFFEIMVSLTNDNPVFSANVPSDFTAWGELIFDPANLAATDEESDNNEIFFTLDPDAQVPFVGKIIVEGTEIGPGGSFTMENIINGEVSYMQTASTTETNDHFIFTITDGDGGMAADGDFTVFEHNINITLTNTESLISNDLQVYPNPGHGVFRVAGYQEADNYVIYSASGKVVKECLIDRSDEMILDISDQAPGIYLLQLRERNSILGNYRLVIR